MPVNFKERKHDLLRRKASLKKEFLQIMEKIHSAKKDDGTEADPEQGDLDRLSKIEQDVEQIDSRLQEVETALEMEAETAEGEGDADGDVERVGTARVSKGARAAAEPVNYAPGGNDKGFRIARFMVGLHQAKMNGGNFQRAAEFVQNRFGDTVVARALNTTGVSTGGALIPQAFLPDLIELLRAKVVVRKLNPVTVPMPGGNLTIPRLAAGATAGYQGELDDIATSQETFDDIQLNAKKLTALVPVSNDLLRRAPMGVEGIIRDDLTETLARREDIAFLRGDGSGGSPIGLLNQAAASNKLLVAPFADTTNPTLLSTTVGVLQGMMLTMEQNMSRMLRPAWIFTPATRFFLMGLRDQVGNFVFAEEMKGGTLMGIPFDTTQQLPGNLNTAAAQGDPAVNNGSEIYLVDMADVILAETYNVTVESSDVATYKDGGGNVVSAFQRDQSLFRVIEEHDLALRHQASVVIAVVPAWVPSGYTNFAAGTSYFVQAPSTSSSAAPSTFGTSPPTGSNNPGNVSAAVPGGTQPGHT